MASRQYPAFQPNALVVLARRYLMKDAQQNPTEDPPNMLRRVANNASLPELGYDHDEEYRQQVEDEFYHVMRMLYFMPNSPTLMNAGRELQQLSACFVLPVEDDLDCIYTRVRDTAMIHQSGGGTGFSFSRLRPNGDIVGSTGGVASGPVSFMQVYDTGTEVVKQGGTRRGANMAILDCTHPDIEAFIDMKLDPNVMTNFNISVSVSDAFMQAAQTGGQWTLYNPRNGKPMGNVNAAALLNKIVANAWQTGDPGLIFLDPINNTHPNQHLGRITATNPCVTGDCWVMTSDGPRQVDEIVGRKFHVMDENGTRQTDARGFYSTGHQETYWLKTSHGYRVRLTGNHRVKRVVSHDSHGINYDYVAAAHLQPGDVLPMQQYEDDWPAPTGGDRHHLRDADAVAQGKLLSATAIGEMHRCSSQYHLNFIAQLMRHTAVHQQDESGSLCGMLLMMQSQAPVHDVQQMLLRLGAMSQIAEDGILIEGRSLHTLASRMTNSAATLAFGQSLRSIMPKMPAALKQGYPREHATTFVALEPAGKADVYDVTVDQQQVVATPVFDGQGFHLHNCGEQPLLDYESCNLGSINLAQIRRDAEDDEEFLRILEQTCKTATHFLDNVIDQNKYPLTAIGERSRATRRIGVGVMGFADLLIMEGIRYDSPEGVDRASELMQFIQARVHEASQQLAIERGPYPEWHNRTNVGEGEIPMRNTSPTTIAPTGTISIIASASSGIEPLFALAYERHVMEDDRLPEYHPLFLEAAGKHGIARDDERILQALETGSLQGLGFPPEMEHVFRVSHEINAEWHVRMQAAWQKHCDNAVSKTINMPEEATEADVMRAYMMAWETGCKGITVYRDGSKSGQVLSTAESRRRSQENEAAETRDSEPGYRRRPGELPGVTYRIRTGHGTTYITINDDPKGKPFEVFVAGGKSGGCDEAQSQAITRLATLALRHNVESEEIRKQLTGIVCCPHFDNGLLIGSLADAIAEALRRHTGSPRDEAPVQIKLIDMAPQPVAALAAAPPQGQAETERALTVREHAMLQLTERRRLGLECPEPGCNGTMIQGEGCGTCRECGYSDCG